MGGVRLAHDQPHPGRRGDVDGLQDLRSRFAHPLGARLVAVNQQLLQLRDLGGRRLVGAVLDHAELQHVGDRIDRDDLLLRGAGQVVVEVGAVDDALRGVLDVGGLVDDGGRIARARADRLLPGAQHRLDDARPPGGHQHPDLRDPLQYLLQRHVE